MSHSQSSAEKEDYISGEYNSAPPQIQNSGGVVTTSEYQSPVYQHKFHYSDLWKPAVINPINGKSMTFNVLRFWDPYATAFWFATLGFFVAFFSWFAFAPLVTEAVKKDLKLTPNQIVNSNLASLGGTAIVRLFAGAAVDRFGSRKVMATLLCLGAIPSALVPTISNIGGLETIRFFISILGGTFVPCQAWTTTFFDKSIAGTANAFSGGWGNLGGGVTPAVMIGLYERLNGSAGLSPHLAWRVCFLVLPVPLLLLIALSMMLLAKDHPAGAWKLRHQLPGTAMEVARGEEVHLDRDEIREQSNNEKGTSIAPMKNARDFQEVNADTTKYTAVDTATSEPLTLKSFVAIITDLRVLMVALCYLATFGLETALDAALPQLITAIFLSPTFTAVDGAFVASLYGCLNLFFRPMGGVIADLLYKKYGPGLGLQVKVWYLLVCAFSQGITLIGLGFYINNNPITVTLGGVCGFIVAIAFFGFQANAGAYAVYAHLRPRNVGTVAGIIGSGGNIGGLFYTLIAKYHPGTTAAGNLGTKFWIMGVFNAALVLPFYFVSLGDAV